MARRWWVYPGQIVLVFLGEGQEAVHQIQPSS
jgi:hypothetical protein